MSEEFVIHDRRLFDKDGRVKDEAPGEAETGPEKPAPGGNPRPAAKEAASPAGARELPPPTLASLLVGLATSALIHLGESQEAGSEPPDLPAAKEAIDLMGVLKVKTAGNLEKEEETLLETLLYDLRLKYVKAAAGKP
ncbi:MAG: DUF1844 domain-containing protein [Candidatus Adiutrix sp.]|nr:DUF1844 domain-containing protein [Candidatus Adiutrix sp.]